MSNSGLKKLCVHFYYVPNIDGHNIKQGDDCVASNALKRNESKVYISLKGNKLTSSYIAKAEGSFQVHDFVHDFWKTCHEVHVFFVDADAPEVSQQGNKKKEKKM